MIRAALIIAIALNMIVIYMSFEVIKLKNRVKQVESYSDVLLAPDGEYFPKTADNCSVSVEDLNVHCKLTAEEINQRLNALEYSTLDAQVAAVRGFIRQKYGEKAWTKYIHGNYKEPL